MVIEMLAYLMCRKAIMCTEGRQGTLIARWKVQIRESLGSAENVAVAIFGHHVSNMEIPYSARIHFRLILYIGVRKPLQSSTIR